MTLRLLALPLAACAAWAGITVHGSSQTLAIFEKLVARLNQMSLLEVTTESGTRSMVKSHAVTEIRTSDSAHANGPLLRMHTTMRCV